MPRPRLAQFQKNSADTEADRVSTRSGGDVDTVLYNEAATIAPAVGNDNTQGYEVGSRWIDVTNDRTYTCVDASTGAAVWKREDNLGGGVQHKFDATVDPVTTNDTTEGYAIGSRWVNTAANTHWVALDVTTNNAIWMETTQDDTLAGIAQLAPGEHMMGNLMNYPNTGGLTASTIQYTQIYLSAGLDIDTVRIFITSGGSGSRNFNVGLYSQSTPTDRQGTPNTRERESGTVNTSGLTSYQDGTFTSYIVPTSGFYWVGMVVDSGALSVAQGEVFRAGFLPQRDETTTGVALPATATSLALTGASAPAYASAVEAGF